MVLSYLRGRSAALEKLGLDSTQVDPGLAATERGMSIPTDVAVPPMSHAPGGGASSPGSSSPATPGGGGSTVGALAGDPAPETHPNFRVLTG